MNKALLLVVDMQKGFLVTDSTRHLTHEVNELISVWKDKDWPIAYSRFVNLPGSNYERLRDWHELMDEPDTELADELVVASPYILKKGSYSAWSGETTSICVSQQLRDVVIVGVDTNECVLATAISVFDSGFIPWIVRDCCASNGGPSAHDRAIQALEVLLGKQQIITKEDIR